MLQKVLNILKKIVLGLVIFYLVLGFVIVPLAIVIGAKVAGSKILKTPVSVKSAFFNPLALSLSINGLRIEDNDKNLLVGFKKFKTNIGVWSLAKKVIRVQEVSLDGLEVNAKLLEGNKINLLELVPAQEPKAEETPAKEAPEGSAKKEMPMVIVDKIIMTNGKVSFTDTTVTPNFQTSLSEMNLNITGVSTDPASQAKAVFNTKLDEKGVISVEGAVKPFVQPLEMETVLSLNSYAMTILTPYVGKYTGRELQNGKMDFSMNYQISNNQLKATHKIVIQKFEFGSKVDSKDALHLPFGLAVALLEDPQGKISISLPVKGDMSDPEFEYWHLVGQVARNFFMKLVTKPFSFLASTLGVEGEGEEEFGSVRFTPGQSDLSDEEKSKLTLLVKGLKDRPKLYLEVNGSYEPNTDWKAIRTQVFVQDLENLKKETTKNESWVYQQLYERRFGVKSLWALTKKFKVKKGEYNNAPLDEEIKRQLIESDSIDKLALEALAQTRAKAVYDFILAEGFDEKRIKVSPVSKEVQSAMGLIPMEFTLTVFDEGAGSEAAEAPAVEIPAESAGKL